MDNDPNIAVRKTAARRPDAPAPVLEKLVREHGDVHNPNLPIDALRHFASAAEAWQRQGSAGHPNIDAELLDRLLADPDANASGGC